MQFVAVCMILTVGNGLDRSAISHHTIAFRSGQDRSLPYLFAPHTRRGELCSPAFPPSPPVIASQRRSVGAAIRFPVSLHYAIQRHLITGFAGASPQGEAIGSAPAYGRTSAFPLRGDSLSEGNVAAGDKRRWKGDRLRWMRWKPMHSSQFTMHSYAIRHRVHDTYGRERS